MYSTAHIMQYTIRRGNHICFVFSLEVKLARQLFTGTKLLLSVLNISMTTVKRPPLTSGMYQRTFKNISQVEKYNRMREICENI